MIEKQVFTNYTKRYWYWFCSLGTTPVRRPNSWANGNPLVGIKLKNDGWEADTLLNHPTRLAQWWVCRTHDLVVVSSISGWGDFSFWHIFASRLCRSMWEKYSVALERKVVFVLVWESQEITYASPTNMNMTLAVKVALNPNTTNQPISSQPLTPLNLSSQPQTPLRFSNV